MYFSLFQICKIHLISSKHKYKQDQGSWWFSLEENFWFQKVHLELPHSQPMVFPSIKQLFWMQDWARNHGERGDNDNFSHRDLWSSLEMGGWIMLHLLRAGILRFWEAVGMKHTLISSYHIAARGLESQSYPGRRSGSRKRIHGSVHLFVHSFIQP